MPRTCVHDRGAPVRRVAGASGIHAPATGALHTTRRLLSGLTPDPDCSIIKHLELRAVASSCPRPCSRWRSATATNGHRSRWPRRSKTVTIDIYPMPSFPAPSASDLVASRYHYVDGLGFQHCLCSARPRRPTYPRVCSHFSLRRSPPGPETARLGPWHRTPTAWSASYLLPAPGWPHRARESPVGQGPRCLDRRAGSTTVEYSRGSRRRS
jgi:hypothetical protein